MRLDNDPILIYKQTTNILTDTMMSSNLEISDLELSFAIHI